MNDIEIRALAERDSAWERIKELAAEVEHLRAALELYACPGLGACPCGRLRDGTCIVAVTTGNCGNDAFEALNGTRTEQPEGK